MEFPLKTWSPRFSDSICTFLSKEIKLHRSIAMFSVLNKCHKIIFHILFIFASSDHWKWPSLYPNLSAILLTNPLLCHYNCPMFSYECVLWFYMYNCQLTNIEYSHPVLYQRLIISVYKKKKHHSKIRKHSYELFLKCSSGSFQNTVTNDLFCC